MMEKEEKLLVESLDDLAKYLFDFDVNNLGPQEWYQISKLTELSEKFIRQYYDKLDWSELINSGCLTESLIRDFHHLITTQDEWERIAAYYENLSKDFIMEFYDKFVPDTLIEYQEVPPKVVYKWLKETRDYDLVRKILEYQKVTPQLIKAIRAVKMEDAIRWYDICKSSKISIKTLEEFKDEISWYAISKHRNLPEKIMLQYKDYIDWDEASEFQKLTKKIIMEVPHKINIERLRKNKKVDQEKLEKEEIYTWLSLIQAK